MDWNAIIPNCVTPEGTATISCIPAVFQLILNFAFGFAGITAVFFIFFAGLKFLMSGGDPKQAEGARKTLTYAIIGLIVILLSVAIINLIAKNFTLGQAGSNCLLNFGLIHC